MNHASKLFESKRKPLPKHENQLKEINKENWQNLKSISRLEEEVIKESRKKELRRSKHRICKCSSSVNCAFNAFETCDFGKKNG